MDSVMMENLARINALAESDEDYCKMECDFKYFEKDFENYVDPLPREIRNFLWGYAHMGILMGNRKLMIACEKMRFPE